MVRRTVLYGLCLLALLGLSQGCSESRASITVEFSHADGSSSPKISAEIASTDSQRRLGLMYRKEMAKDAGMLFIFPGEAERSFWMKNTYLELDIIFLDKDFRVVSVIPKAVPLSESPRKSSGPATYVLELLGGQAKAFSIDVGSMMKVEGELPSPR